MKGKSHLTSLGVGRLETFILDWPLPSVSWCYLVRVHVLSLTLLSSEIGTIILSRMVVRNK